MCVIAVTRTRTEALLARARGYGIPSLVNPLGSYYSPQTCGWSRTVAPSQLLVQVGLFMWGCRS